MRSLHNKYEVIKMAEDYNIVRINDKEKHTFSIAGAKLEGLIKHLKKIGKQLNPKDAPVKK